MITAQFIKQLGKGLIAFTISCMAIPGIIFTSGDGVLYAADTTPPTAPSNLTASATSASRINLAWTASTDDVGVYRYYLERCQGTGCTNFAQLATVNGTTYANSKLQQATSYNYRVRARDAAGNYSGYSNIAGATTRDTTAPTAPRNLTASAASASQINLAWTASTDNVGVTGYQVQRCQGASCTNFALVTTVTGTTYNDMGLLAGTSYRYRVRATDASNNLSTFSATATATTQTASDTTPPTVPSNLTATAVSSGQINLAWTASTDNVGVTGYQIERCQGAGCSTFSQIATTTTTAYNNTGLSASASYSYRVRATDAANNLSPYSGSASATTQTSSDPTPPTAPSNLTATAVSSSQINLAWTASTDNVGVTGYQIERCQGAGCSTFSQIATPTTTTYTNTGLQASTSYSYRVRATDAANNLSPYSGTASATTQQSANQPGLVAAYGLNEGSGSTTADASGNSNTGTISGAAWTSSGRYGSALSFNGSSNRIIINDSNSLDLKTGMTLEAWVYPTSLSGWRSVILKETSGGLAYALYAYDNAPHPAVYINTGGSDMSAVGTTGISVNTWTHLAATYDGTTLRLYVNGVQAGTRTISGSIPASTSPLSIGGNSVWGEYFSGQIDEVRVYSRALSQAEIQTDMNTAIAITPSDTIPPTAPANLTAAAASSSQINLAWTASTDNVGVTGYQIERCQGAGCSTFSQIDTTTTTTYNNTGLSASTSYSYRVRATDAANNLSPYSGIASATTQTASDPTPPTAPSGLTATAASSSQVNLSWTASTDNVGVTGYQIERCQGVGCSTFSQIATSTTTTYTNTGLQASTSYSYRVRATDAANNLSPYSGTANATTQTAGVEPAGWYAGDPHVHRSCGGSPESLSSMYQKMSSQDLAVISLLADMGNGEVQNPVTDLPLVNGQDASVSTPGRIVHWDAEWHWDAVYSQYAHQALGGHIVSLGLSEAHQIWQEYTYPIINWAHQQNAHALSGFVHMQYLDDNIPQSLNCCIPVEYPVEVALGSADFIEEDVNGGDSAIHAYYRLLNTGFRPSFTAGTDYPCGVSEVGSLLTYVQVAGGQMTYGNWIDGIAGGRTVVSRNGHNEFLDLSVNNNATPGDEIKLTGAGSVPVTVIWTANQSLSGTIELVQNGVVVASKQASVSSGTSASLTATVDFTKSGWLAARRMGNNEHQVHTGAVFVTVNNAPVRASVDDATFYVQWMDNLLTNTSPGGDWNWYFPTSLSQAQARYQAAKAIYQQIALEAAGQTTPLTITTTSLPGATQYAAYSATLAATGGMTPYTWSILSGTLPAGLSLNPGTGGISGTSVNTGTFSFTVQAADTAQVLKQYASRAAAWQKSITLFS